MNAGFLLAAAPLAAVVGEKGGAWGSIGHGLLAVMGAVVLLIVAVIVVTVIREIRGELYAAIRAVGCSIWRHQVRIGQFGFATLAVGGVGAAVWAPESARRHDYWCVPDKRPVPESLREAGQLSAAIARDDAALQSEMDKIATLIDLERPDKFDIFKEIMTAEALRAYIEKLLRLGESALGSLGRMKKTARELDVLLKEAPARYREMAKLARSYGDEETRADIKEEYRALADIWEAKAKAALQHHGDVQNTLNSDLEDYLKAQNVFLERLLTMLNTGFAVNELRDVAEFTKTFQDVARGHEYLRCVLQAWRKRMVSEVTKPAA